MSHFPLKILTLVVAAGLTSGCGKQKQPWETVYPAAGKIQYKGEPLWGAQVTLVPVDEKIPASVRPTATTDWDGTFQLGTYSLADGAPAGDYKVVVLHYPVVGPKESPSAGPNDLPRKYATAKTSDLNVTVSEVATKFPLLEIK
jgi:hypothetical protein